MLNNPDWAILTTSGLVQQYGTYILSVLVVLIILIRFPRWPRW